MVTAVGRSAVADAPGGLHGFPAALTSFVGRAQVADEVAAQLGQYRLVTVTGPGGAGKTRLAGEVAKQVAGLAPAACQRHRCRNDAHQTTWLPQRAVDAVPVLGR
jgi:ABC-type Mn2+/Zn2+ transport system ATPase subunit